jgi:hypothetical protein
MEAQHGTYVKARTLEEYRCLYSRTNVAAAATMRVMAAVSERAAPRPALSRAAITAFAQEIRSAILHEQQNGICVNTTRSA